jgi:dTDP-4-dehydrorhamnose reductase
MTSLVVGASGQVGTLLHRSLSAAGACVGTAFRHTGPGLLPLDLADGAAVEELVRRLRAAVCYLPAAHTAVDDAERHPERCRAVNVDGTARLAAALAATTDAVLVFFSTEHVFGDDPRPRREDEPTAPLSVYARTKAEAEEAVRALLPRRHLILRTSWVFGPDPQGKNFLCRLTRTLSGGEALVVPSDQHGQPTFGPDLARTAIELADRGARGTFHVVGPRYLSRLAWARIIAERLGLPAERLKGRTTAELAPAAPRPLQVRLDRDKLLRFLGRDPIRAPEEGVNPNVGVG